MKKYKYLGTSILSFTHGENDFIIHGTGPHDLPEEADIVKVNVARGVLVDADPEPKKK